MLTQGVIPPHFLSRDAVKNALNRLSLKIQERQQGKTLASLEPSAMTDFPIHLARQNDRYFILVAIPIMTPNTRQLPTFELTKKSFFFTFHDHAYRLDLNPDLQVLSPNSNYNSGVLMNKADFEHCFMHDKIRYCRVRAIAKATPSNCLLSIWKFHQKGIIRNCHLEIVKITNSDVIPLSRNTYQIMLQDAQTLTVDCKTNHSERSLESLLIYQFQLDAACSSIYNDRYILAADTTGLFDRFTSRFFNTASLMDAVLRFTPFLQAEFQHYTDTISLDSLDSNPADLTTSEMFLVTLSSLITTTLMCIMCLIRKCTQKLRKKVEEHIQDDISDPPRYLPSSIQSLLNKT